MKREDITITSESGQYYRDLGGCKVRVYSLDTGDDWVHAAYWDKEAEMWFQRSCLPSTLTPMPEDHTFWINEYPKKLFVGRWNTKEQADANAYQDRIRLHRVVIGPDTVYKEDGK